MNWGTKIVLGMATFMVFIIAMVVYMFRVHGRDALIEENYYEKGINYNTEYDARQNVINDAAQPKITLSKSQLLIQLKDSAPYDVVLMRPANSADDVKQKGITQGAANLIVIDKSKMHKGLWFLNLRWHAKGKDYQFKNNITL